MSRTTLFVLLVVVLIVLAPYTFLPSTLESVIARTIQDRTGFAQPPQIELESSPPITMYAGRFSKVRIAVRGYELSGVPTKYVALELDPLDINLLDSVTSRTLSTAQPLSGRLQVKLTDATSLRLTQAGFPLPPQKVELSHRQILAILSGQAPLGLPIGY